MPWHVPTWVQFLWDSLGFLDFPEVYFLHQIGKFSFIICSNKFSISCGCSSPSGTSMIWMLGCLKLSWRFLSLFSFYWISLPSFCSSWMFISSFYSESLIGVSFPSFLSLLVPCIFCFILLWVKSLLSFCNWAQSVLWASWLPVFWTLHQIGCLSPGKLALFLEFWSVFSFGPYLFVSAHLLCWKGVEPQVFTRVRQPSSLRCGTVCGGGVRQVTMLLACSALAPTSNELSC